MKSHKFMLTIESTDRYTGSGGGPVRTEHSPATVHAANAGSAWRKVLALQHKREDAHYWRVHKLVGIRLIAEA